MRDALMSAVLIAATGMPTNYTTAANPPDPYARLRRNRSKPSRYIDARMTPEQLVWNDAIDAKNKLKAKP